MVRRTVAGDRSGFIDLHTSAEVGRYLGGPRQRAALGNSVAQVPGDRPGVFTVERDGVFLGMVSFARRDRERPGHLRLDGGEAEIGYMFLPAAWGFGYAVEACAAALDWFAGVRPGEPVLLCTQTANERSMRLAAKLGFTEIERFEEWDAEQWLGRWTSATPSG